MVNPADYFGINVVGTTQPARRDARGRRRAVRLLLDRRRLRRCRARLPNPRGGTDRNRSIPYGAVETDGRADAGRLMRARYGISYVALPLLQRGRGHGRRAARTTIRKRTSSRSRSTPSRASAPRSPSSAPTTRRRDGTAIRDYVHVIDLADAHVLALEAGSQRLGVFNLGTRGRILGVRRSSQAVERSPADRSCQSPSERRAGDPPALIAEPTEPRAAGLASAALDPRLMIGSAWEWMQRTRRATTATLSSRAGRASRVAEPALGAVEQTPDVGAVLADDDRGDHGDRQRPIPRAIASAASSNSTALTDRAADDGGQRDVAGRSGRSHHQGEGQQHPGNERGRGAGAGRHPFAARKARNGDQQWPATAATAASRRSPSPVQSSAAGQEDWNEALGEIEHEDGERELPAEDAERVRRPGAAAPVATHIDALRNSRPNTKPQGTRPASVG